MGRQRVDKAEGRLEIVERKVDGLTADVRRLMMASVDRGEALSGREARIAELEAPRR